MTPYIGKAYFKSLFDYISAIAACAAASLATGTRNGEHDT
jgi:hypothetical protein